jgi:hypothetical protein
MNDQNNFQYGEMDSQTGSPPFETMGAVYSVQAVQQGRGYHDPLISQYMLQSITERNGSTERTVPGIVQTPLGGLMPGPFAVPPAVMAGQVGAAMIPGHETMEFTMGISDGWPDGSPVPVR